MKKIFTYLAVAALLAVACDNMYGPVEMPLAPDTDKSGSVKIQLDTLGDDTLAFTLSPVGEAAYYSYFVAEGPAQAVDSSMVYTCSYDGLIKGTFKAAEDSVATLTVGELSPNTPYTIYAVAGSPMGFAGSVSVKEVVTTDGITLALTAADTEVNDSTVVLTFSEDVFLGEGKVTATYYARNLGFKEMGTVEAVADSVVVEGNTVTVQFAGLPHGADWSVAYPEGAFTDSAKNKVKELKAGQWVTDPETEEDVPVGVWSRKDTVAFALEAALPKEQQMFNDWRTAAFSVGTAVDSTLAVVGKGAVTANYLTPGKKLTIDMTYETDYMFGESEGKSGVMMVCPEEPAYGTTIVFAFEQDAFQDIWGNPTKAAELATLCAYDYTLEDVLGTYNFQAISAFDEVTAETGSLVIEMSDNEEYGNVMITSFTFSPNWDIEAPIYASFTPASGSLDIYGHQWIATAGTSTPDDLTDDYDRYFSTYQNEWLNLTMVERGVLANPTDTFGCLAVAGESALGWNAVYCDFDAQKITPSEVTPSSVKLEKQLNPSILPLKKSLK